MADLKNDIEKYLKGELGPKEMHALEKKALSDPFLAEALEGSDSVQSEDFLNDVAELERRIQRAKGRRAWIVPLRIAASLAVLLGISYGIYTLVKPDKPITLAQNAPKDAPAPPKTTGPQDSISKPATEKNLLSLNQASPVQPKGKPKGETKPAFVPDPATLNAVASAQGRAGAGDSSSMAPVQERDLAAVKTDEGFVEQAADKIAAAEAETSRSKRKDTTRQHALHINDAPVTMVPRPQMVISGKVTAAEDNSPLPGVNIVIKGTTQGAVSDAGGNYQLVTSTPVNDLVFSFIGYESVEVKLPDSQSQLNVQLSPDITQLSEVVVTGYGFSKKEDDSEPPAPIRLAEPLGGRRAYKKYLDNNLKYPQAAVDQKIEGKVTLEFTVQTGGELSDFDVLHGLGFGCSEEVIRLVKEGPRWNPSLQADVPLESRVRIGVRFKLPK